MNEAEDSLKVVRHCLEAELYKDSINRSYYSAFYAIKAVLALGIVDFKRHKDVTAYFNQHYVATGVFDRDIGRRLGMLKQLREKSDYDDFYIASKNQAETQLETAESLMKRIKDYIKNVTEAENENE